jgi:hypothetical protein
LPRDSSPVTLAQRSAGYHLEAEFRAITPPPLPRESTSEWDLSQDEAPTATARRRTRFDSGPVTTAPVEGRERPIGEPRRDRSPAVEHLPSEIARSLEGRLGERYQDRNMESKRRSPVLPPAIPSQQRERGFYESPPLRRDRLEARTLPSDFDHHRGWEGDERGHGGMQRRGPSPIRDHTDRPRMEAQGPLDQHEPNRMRTSTVDHDRRSKAYAERPRDLPSRPGGLAESTHYHPEGQSHRMESHPSRSEYDHESRAHAMRRGGSLLDRLSLDTGMDTATLPPSPSLRDRVQVPVKRDREDVMEANEPGEDFDLDDGGGADPSKRSKKRVGGKYRRGRRNGYKTVD